MFSVVVYLKEYFSSAFPPGCIKSVLQEVFSSSDHRRISLSFYSEKKSQRKGLVKVRSLGGTAAAVIDDDPPPELRESPCGEVTCARGRA